jgi:ethanolamine utilization protein EutS
LIVHEARERIVEESVPGKQVTLAHVIAGPGESLYAGIELPQDGRATGILRVTPSITAIIAADAAAKAGGVELAIMDRFSGAVVIFGDVAAVKAGLRGAEEVLCGKMGFAAVPITQS